MTSFLDHRLVCSEAGHVSLLVEVSRAVVNTKKKKFTVANLHNKRPHDAMSMLSRRMVLDVQSRTKTSKTLRRDMVQRSRVWFDPVPGMVRQLSVRKWVQRSQITREKG